MKADSGALKVPGNLDSIAQIRHWLEGLLVGWDVPHDTVNDILSAVTEVCTNVVRHGYSADNAGAIELDADYQADTIKITFADCAPSLVPETEEATLPARRLAEGGYGTYMIHSLVDEVTYEPLGETGNRTTLVKRVSTSPAGPQNS